MRKTIRNITKSVIYITAAVGAGALAANLVRVTTPGDTKKLLKGCIDVGAIVASWAATDYVASQSEELVDMSFDVFDVFFPEKKQKEDIVVDCEVES